ncbi:Uncharacterised protein [Legionella sainthelensi]|nr:Uncharacterised protein [Legionella sainthelensi]
MITGTNKLELPNKPLDTGEPQEQSAGNSPISYGSRSRDYWVIILLRKSEVI